jgi:hypothetical protein
VKRTGIGSPRSDRPLPETGPASDQRAGSRGPSGRLRPVDRRRPQRHARRQRRGHPLPRRGERRRRRVGNHRRPDRRDHGHRRRPVRARCNRRVHGPPAARGAELRTSNAGKGWPGRVSRGPCLTSVGGNSSHRIGPVPPGRRTGPMPADRRLQRTRIAGRSRLLQRNRPRMTADRRTEPASTAGGFVLAGGLRHPTRPTARRTEPDSYNGSDGDCRRPPTRPPHARRERGQESKGGIGPALMERPQPETERPRPVPTVACRPDRGQRPARVTVCPLPPRRADH